MSTQDISKDRLGRDIIAKVDWKRIGSFFLVKDNDKYKLVPSNFVDESSYITNGGHEISMVGYSLVPNQEHTLDDNFIILYRFTVDNIPCKDKDDFLEKLKTANIKPRVDYFEYNKKEIRDEILLGTKKMRELEPEKYKIAEYTKLYEEYSSLYNQLYKKLKDCANSFYDTDKDDKSMQILKEKFAYREFESYADGFKKAFDDVFFTESNDLDKTEEEKNNENIVKRLNQIQPQLKKHVEVLNKISNDIGECNSIGGEGFFEKVAGVLLKHKESLKTLKENIYLNLGKGEWFLEYDIKTHEARIWCKETDSRVTIEETFNINSPLLNKKYITYKFTNKEEKSKNISLPKHILPRIMNNAFILYDSSTKEQVVFKFGDENEYKKITCVENVDKLLNAKKNKYPESQFLKKIMLGICQYDDFLDGLDCVTHMHKFDEKMKMTGECDCEWDTKKQSYRINVGQGGCVSGDGLSFRNGNKNVNNKEPCRTTMWHQGDWFNFFSK